LLAARANCWRVGRVRGRDAKLDAAFADADRYYHPNHEGVAFPLSNEPQTDPMKRIAEWRTQKSTRMSKRILTLGNFLNVDVGLTSRRQLTTLADELKKWIGHHGRLNGGWLLTFETSSIQGKSTPDGVIAICCAKTERARRISLIASSRSTKIPRRLMPQ